MFNITFTAQLSWRFTFPRAVWKWILAFNDNLNKFLVVLWATIENGEGNLFNNNKKKKGNCWNILKIDKMLSTQFAKKLHVAKTVLYMRVQHKLIVIHRRIESFYTNWNNIVTPSKVLWSIVQWSGTTYNTPLSQFWRDLIFYWCVLHKPDWPHWIWL